MPRPIVVQNMEAISQVAGSSSKCPCSGRAFVSIASQYFGGGVRNPWYYDPEHSVTEDLARGG